MNKHIIIFLLSCLLQRVSAQNWQLFPQVQLSHYITETGDHEISSFQSDSVRYDAGLAIHYFRKYMGMSDTCYWQNLGMMNSGSFSIDSLVYNDTIALYYFREGDSVFDFAFDYTAKPGDEWNLSSHLSRKGYCTNSDIDTIFGYTDSVKTFTLESAAYGNIEIKLSKIFGLTQFVPFTDFFLEVPLNMSSIPYYQLIGFQNELESQGFELPGFFDYFHLSTGDLFLWKKTFYPSVDRTTQYLRDSIQSVATNAEGISYTIRRIVYTSEAEEIQTIDTIILYSVNDYNSFINVPSGWVAGHESGTHNEIIFIDKVNFDFNDPDTAIKLEVNIPGCVLFQSDNNCEVVCLDGMSDGLLKFSTSEGLTYHYEYFIDNETVLIGSKINGTLRGSLEIPSAIEKPFNCPINIFPNPSPGNITLSNSQLVRRTEIFNQWGKLILTTKCITRIDLSDQPPGCYYLRIFTNSGDVFNQKVILIR